LIQNKNINTNTKNTNPMLVIKHNHR